MYCAPAAAVAALTSRCQIKFYLEDIFPCTFFFWVSDTTVPYSKNNLNGLVKTVAVFKEVL